MTIHSISTVVYPGVSWGGEPKLGPFVVIGEPARGREAGAVPTIIGAGAEIRSHSVIYDGNRIGERLKTGHGALIREDNLIGDDVSIGTGCVIEHHVTIGNGVRLHSNVFVPEFTVLEDNCWIGPNVVFTNAKYPRSPRAKDELNGAHVEAGAIIGANATLLPGVRISRNALIGAGAVVTRDVPPGTVVVGNPARSVKTVSNLPYGAVA